MADKNHCTDNSVEKLLEVPEFSLQDIYERMGGEVDGTVFGTAHSLRGYPNLVVKTIKLEGLTRTAVEDIKIALLTLTELSYPGIIKYYQVIDDDGFIFVIMEYRQESPEQVTVEPKQKTSPATTEMLFSILGKITNAISGSNTVNIIDTSEDSAHRIVCRQLQSSNVLIGENEQSTISVDNGSSTSTSVSGSSKIKKMEYMAPETILRGETGLSSDVWVLGCIIYELTALEKLNFLDGKDPAEVFVDGWKPDLSAVKDEFLKGILEKIFVLNPQARPAIGQLSELFRASQILTSKLGPQIKALMGGYESLDPVLNNLSCNITFVEEETTAKSGVISSRDQRLQQITNDLISSNGDVSSLANVDDVQFIDLTSLEDRSDITNSLKKELNSRSDGVVVIRAKLKSKDSTLDAIEAYYNTIEQRFNNAAKFFNSTASDSELLVLKPPAPHVLMPIKTAPDPEPPAPADSTPLTPLMRAVVAGDVEAVKAHIDDKDTVNADGDTAFSLAVKAGRGSMLEILDPTDEDGVTALMRAADRGDTEAVKLLIPLQERKQAAGRVKIHNWSVFGRTALMGAAAYGHTEVVKLLVEHERNIMDKDGWTALIWASRYNNPECVKLLLGKEAGGQDNYGCTALMYAAENNNLECVKLLLEREGGMQKKDGWTALMRATYKNNVECVKLLSKKEKDMKNSRGKTALNIAKEYGYNKIVSILSKCQ